MSNPPPSLSPPPVYVVRAGFVHKLDTSIVVQESRIFTPNDDSKRSETPSIIVLEMGPDKDLQIRRPDPSWRVPLETDAGVVYFSCILGIFELISGPYLALVTRDSIVGNVPPKARLFRAEGVVLLPISSHQTASLTESQLADEQRYLQMLEWVVGTKSFYFSHEYDITHTAQRVCAMNATPSTANVPMWVRADKRFFWNRHLMVPFMEAKLHEWIVPITNGFIEVSRACQIGDTHFTIAFFSRRACQRQGTRFNVRGLDKDGQVANFVETEQIICRDKEVETDRQKFVNNKRVRSFASTGQISSFVQTRGSVPVFWQQSPTMKYTPTIDLTRTTSQSEEAAEKHLVEQLELYGDTVCVNLIDKKSDQLKLGKAFEGVVENTKKKDQLGPNRLKYVWFDFHHECRKMKWHNLGKLMEQVEADLENAGFFYVDLSQGEVLKTQRGVIRSNCVDNLDRTNVVQSLFARRSLLTQLERREVSNVLESPFASFERVFKNLWGDNADALSVLYTGTGALKTDFTRTGKRTKKGALQDFKNSVQRYYLNNFVDGYRQDAFDLFLGKFVPGSKKTRRPGGVGYVSPFKNQQDRNLFFTLLFALVFFFLAIVRGSLKKFRGRDFVSRPSLVQHHVDMDAKKEK